MSSSYSYSVVIIYHHISCNVYNIYPANTFTPLNVILRFIFSCILCIIYDILCIIYCESDIILQTSNFMWNVKCSIGVGAENVWIWTETRSQRKRLSAAEIVQPALPKKWRRLQEWQDYKSCLSGKTNILSNVCQIFVFLAKYLYFLPNICISCQIFAFFAKYLYFLLNICISC